MMMPNSIQNRCNNVVLSSSSFGPQLMADPLTSHYCNVPKYHLANSASSLPGSNWITF